MDKCQQVGNEVVSGMVHPVFLLDSALAPLSVLLLAHLCVSLALSGIISHHLFQARYSLSECPYQTIIC